MTGFVLAEGTHQTRCLFGQGASTPNWPRTCRLLKWFQSCCDRLLPLKAYCLCISGIELHSGSAASGRRCRGALPKLSCNMFSNSQAWISHSQLSALSCRPIQPISSLSCWPRHRVASTTVTQLVTADLEVPQQESYKLLEWPQVCEQVVAFTQTSLAAERIAQEYLPIGSSQVVHLAKQLLSSHLPSSTARHRQQLLRQEVE